MTWSTVTSDAVVALMARPPGSRQWSPDPRRRGTAYGSVSISSSSISPASTSSLPLLVLGLALVELGHHLGGEQLEARADVARACCCPAWLSRITWSTLRRLELAQLGADRLRRADQAAGVHFCPAGVSRRPGTPPTGSPCPARPGRACCRSAARTGRTSSRRPCALASSSVAAHMNAAHDRDVRVRLVVGRACRGAW